MKVIGLVGGVASGKSSVADALRRRGAVVLNADAAGHEALKQPAVQEALRGRWGARVFDAAGEVNRQAVAEIAFADPGAPGKSRDELKFLESVTHPLIAKSLSSQLAAFRQRGEASLAVLDAAVMLKAGWDRFCDHIVFVDAPRDVRLARARQRGWTEKQFAAREAALPLTDIILMRHGRSESDSAASEADGDWGADYTVRKHAHFDFVLDSSGPLSQLETEVDRLWNQLGPR